MRPSQAKHHRLLENSVPQDAKIITWNCITRVTGKTLFFKSLDHLWNTKNIRNLSGVLGVFLVWFWFVEVFFCFFLFCFAFFFYSSFLWFKNLKQDKIFQNKKIMVNLDCTCSPWSQVNYRWSHSLRKV